MEQALVSIIVPVYNVEKYICETIDCVRKQTYKNWELLLVEDCSKDNTVAVVREYLEEVQDDRVRLICQEKNSGAAGSRNRGVKEARGRYIAYLDADDLWVPEKLEKELAFMERKQAAFAFTGYEFADENGRGTGKIVKVPEQITYEEALKNTTIFTSTVMFDLSLLGKENVRMPAIESEDTACWWRILRGGVTAYGLNESLTLYRRSAGSLSSNKSTAIRRIWRLYREAEGLSVIKSAYCFVFWAVRAVLRRI